MTSIRWRFIIIYLSVIIVSFVTVTIVAARIVEENLVSQRVGERMKQVSNLSTSISPLLNDANAQSMYTLALEQGRELSGRVLVLNNAGIVQIDSFSKLNGKQIKTKEIVDVLSDRMDNAYGFHLIHPDGDGKDFWSVYYASALIYDSKTVGVLVFSQSIQDVVDKTTLIRERFIYIYLVACVIIIIATLLLTNHITKPIKQLRNVAVQIAKGNLHQRVKISGKNEIAELGRTFNLMSERLENVDLQRNEFVSNASHELKTPLTSMKILVESILYQENIEEKVYKEFLTDINEEIDRLTALINDLLLMTKLDSDQSRLNMKPILLGRLVEQTVAALRPIAQTKNISISIQMQEDIEVECDALRIRQAVNNLVDNAIKYTQEGGEIEVRVEVITGFAVVTVKDNGVGIAEADIPHIFDRFYRVDKARSRETGGTGLGLHIVRRIALLHNGSVEVESTPGEGSEFMFIIPLKQSK